MDLYFKKNKYFTFQKIKNNLNAFVVLFKDNSIYKLLLLSLVLLAQNFIYFYFHWFNDYSFPGDFEKTYHAIPYYLVEAYHAGAGLDWIPFAGMGYPTTLNLQSGLFYPPFWFIALLGLSYTIKTAVLLQCLTVFFGALGCSMLARSVGSSWKAALFAGFCYQGFGGFYLNAMHPDIIRGFALTPWLCLSLFARWGGSLSRSFKLYLVLLPLIVYLLWSGGYPGITIAALFIVTALTLIRSIFHINKTIPLFIIIGISLGTLFALPVILPALLMKSDIGRSTLTNIHHDYAVWNDFFALFYNTRINFFKHDPTMNSLYVGVPVMALFVVGIRSILKNSIGIWLLVSGMFAAILASGIFCNFISQIVPQLQYSRFIYSDYKAFIVLPIIIGAAISLDQKMNWKTNNLFFFFYFISIGNLLVVLNGKNSLRDVLYLTTILLVAAILIIKTRLFSREVFFSVFLLLVACDWVRTHWSDPHHSGYAFKGGIQLFESGKRFDQAGISYRDELANLRQKLIDPPKQRPERKDITENNYCWKGYYSGEYLMRDWSGPMQFSRQRSILASQELMDFAKQEWMALFIPSDKILFGNWRKWTRCQVSPMKYSTDSVEYEITIPEDGVFITNELFFVGWTAEFRNLNSLQTDKVTPHSVDGFRAFKVKKGKYLVIESYETPFTKYILLAIVVAIISFSVYALLIINNFVLLRNIS